MSKGSARRPGSGYADGWSRIFEGKTAEDRQADQEAKNREARELLDSMPVAEKIARDIGLWAIPMEVRGSSKVHNEKVLAFADAIEKRKTFTLIRPLIGGNCGECKYRHQSGDRLARCINKSVLEMAHVTADDIVDLTVEPDFGCNRWEKKE